MTERIEQGSPEWLQQRSGKFTGSRFCDLMARSKKDGGKLKAWHDLIWQVVVERMTGTFKEGPQAAALEWGKEQEPFALMAYEARTGRFVDTCGFILHPDYPMAGASPDGLIGADRGLEMKCPKDPAVHLERFLTGVPDEYVPQIQGGMWVTGRACWDFVSFDPRMPESHRLLVIEVKRDDKMIVAIEAAVLEAEAEVAARIEELTRRAA